MLGMDANWTPRQQQVINHKCADMLAKSTAQALHMPDGPHSNAGHLEEEMEMLPSKSYMHLIESMSCNKSVILTQLCTGHLPLNSYLLPLLLSQFIDTTKCFKTAPTPPPLPTLTMALGM
ncbi:hypothetical protein H2248_008113 [Termitomyces sp. 'cryptogamus']|nr:hypothetical protein H2248_008113 [Termitomyces sp. 'cryptogamus']